MNIQGGGEICAVLDAAVFSHAAPSLKDLRVLTPGGEVPYAITLSGALDPTTDTALPVQVRYQPKGADFDLEMPRRPYTDVMLDLPQQNFLITATVSGMNDPISAKRIPLGTFTLFDLTARHLSRNADLPLQESDFRYLHVELRGTRLPPGSIRGAQVPPSREAQTIYTDVAETSSVSQRGADTVVSFHVPAHVPVERVSIGLSPGDAGNFNRMVRVSGRADSPGAPVETIEGAISQVRLGKIHERQTVFPAIMGVNLQQDALIEVAIENGSEPPLPITSVKLQMRRRSVCFTAPSAPFALFYGDASLAAPRFAANARQATQSAAMQVALGPEIRNPAFSERQDARTLRERRPDLLWFLLLAGMGALGTLMMHTLRRR